VYTVGAGDTLQSIARSAYGDAGLWYRIADANGLSDNSGLRVGQALTIPNRVGTVSNNASTFKPYDPSKVQGDTTPNLPSPVAGEQDDGCGGLGQILMVIVAVVVTVITYGAATAYLGASLGATITAGAVAGAAGAIASQAVGNALGIVDGFDWKAVALGAIGGAVSGGLSQFSAFAGAANSTANVIVRAAIGNAMTQGIAVATGLQAKFDWKGVAIAAAGAGVGSAVSEGLGDSVMRDDAGNAFLDKNGNYERWAGTGALSALGRTGDIIRSGLSGAAAGITTASLRGGKIDIARIATDAFGNALGSSWGEQINASVQEGKLAQMSNENRREANRFASGVATNSDNSPGGASQATALAQDELLGGGALRSRGLNGVGSSTATVSKADSTDDSVEAAHALLVDQAESDFAQNDVTGMRKVNLSNLSGSEARLVATQNAAKLKDYGLGLYELSEQVRTSDPGSDDSVVNAYLRGDKTLHRWARTEQAGLPEFTNMNEARDFLNQRLQGTVDNIDRAVTDIGGLLSGGGHIYDNRARFPGAYVLAKGVSENDIATLGQASTMGTIASIAFPVIGPLGQMAALHNDRVIAKTLFDVGILDKETYGAVDAGIANGVKGSQFALALGVGLGAVAAGAPRLWLAVEGRMVSGQIEAAATRATERMIADKSAGVVFKNAGAQGTRAHTYFEQELIQLNNKLQANGSRYGIEAEKFLDRASGLDAARRAKNSWGLDARVMRDGIPYKGFDLKTGQGWDAAGLQARQQLFNVPIKQLYRARTI
jgi:LysM domain